MENLTSLFPNIRPTESARIYCTDQITKRQLERAYDDIGGTACNEAKDRPFSSTHYHSRQYCRYLSRVFAKYGRSGMALDVGCGDGRSMEWLLTYGADHCVGVDVTLDALRRASANERLRNATFIHSNPLDLEIAPGSVEVVSAFESLHYLGDDYEKGMTRLAEAVRPGGLLITADHDLEAGVLYAVMKQGLSIVERCVNEQQSVESIGDFVPVRNICQSQKAELLNDLGMTQVEQWGISALPMFLIDFFYNHTDQSESLKQATMRALDTVAEMDTHFNRIVLTVHQRP